MLDSRNISSEEIRQKFLDFFKERGHKVVPSSSLIPDDPSVLLTTAGMQQFKKYYTAELDALKDFGTRQVVSCQKCFRTSDIESVGDKTHLTLFEMLGNFSFGDYFKNSSIRWAYEFVTEVLEISSERIKVSVFDGDPPPLKDTASYEANKASQSFKGGGGIPFDEESYKIWHQEIGLPENKIIRAGRQDNFWGPTGDEGPCGPTTEIYVDDIEIWNLVFNEYYQEKTPKESKLPTGQGGEFKKVENPGVDTGMGLERLVSVLQGVDDVFETDLFKPLVSKIQELAPGLEKRVVKILADHLRASIFLIADGLRPSNKEAGYVLRRLLRRILAYKIKYDIHADLLPDAAEIVKEKFSRVYSELKETKTILEVLESEAQKFQEAIGRGIKEIEKLASRNQEIKGQEAFYLYETFGLPFELVKELAPETAVKNLLKEDFDKEFQKHQKISRAGLEKKFGGHGLLLDTGEIRAVSEEEMQKVTRLHTATHLLQWALTEVLGKNIRQMGSDITAERTRFDFSFDRKLTSDEIKKIEDLVNRKIEEDLPVYFREMPKEEAEEIGALAFFKTKYPERVKVYFIGKKGKEISAEFCAGPHVKQTSEIGAFRIIKEEAVSSGVRRIRASVG